MAAIQGIDLDEDNDAEERFNEVNRRAQARLTGKTLESIELSEFGIDMEME